MAESKIKGLSRIVIHEAGRKSIPSGGGGVTGLTSNLIYGEANSGVYLITAMIRAANGSFKENDLQLRLISTGVQADGVVQKGITDTSIGQTATLIGTGGSLSLSTFQTSGSAINLDYELWVIQLL